jgi:hypothetical protein
VANHLRRQIREAVGTAVMGLTTTGARVFQSRVYPAQTIELPCLLIYTTSETASVITIQRPGVMDRLLQLQVVVVAKVASDLDDVLDGICKEVETALAMPVTGLGALAKTIVLTGTEIEMAGTAEKPVGSATMTFEVNYFTAENAPDVAL